MRPGPDIAPKNTAAIVVGPMRPHTWQMAVPSTERWGALAKSQVVRPKNSSHAVPGANGGEAQ